MFILSGSMICMIGSSHYIDLLQLPETTVKTAVLSVALHHILNVSAEMSSGEIRPCISFSNKNTQGLIMIKKYKSWSIHG